MKAICYRCQEIVEGENSDSLGEAFSEHVIKVHQLRGQISRKLLKDETYVPLGGIDGIGYMIDYEGPIDRGYTEKYQRNGKVFTAGSGFSLVDYMASSRERRKERLDINND